MTTAQSIVLVSSLIAAALFFLAGILAARALLIPVLERERSDAKTRERDREALMKRSESELEGAVGEGDRLQQSLAEAQTRLAESIRRVAELEPCEARVALAAQEVEDLHRRLDTHHAELEALREGNKALETRCHGLTAKLEHCVPELAACQERIVALQALHAEVDRLQRVLDLTRAENADLRSRALVAQVPEPLPEIVAEQGDFGKRLDAILVRLSRIEGARRAVVADGHGLLVAGAGDGGDGLAVLAALFDEIAQQVSRMTDFGELRRVTLMDRNSLAIAIQAIPIDHERLFLVSMSAGPGMDMEQLDGVIHEAISPGSGADEYLTPP